MRNTADVSGGKPIAVLLQSILGVNAINPLVAFYDSHGGKREALFFYFGPGHHTRHLKIIFKNGISLDQGKFPFNFLRLSPHIRDHPAMLPAATIMYYFCAKRFERFFADCQTLLLNFPSKFCISLHLQ
jgi:hypothetical protein